MRRSVLISPQRQLMHSRSKATVEGAGVAVVGVDVDMVLVLVLGAGVTTTTGGGVVTVLGHSIDASHWKKLSCPTRTYTVGDGGGDELQHISSSTSCPRIVPEISFNLILLTAKELLQQLSS